MTTRHKISRARAQVCSCLQQLGVMPDLAHDVAVQIAAMAARVLAPELMTLIHGGHGKNATPARCCRPHDVTVGSHALVESVIEEPDAVRGDDHGERVDP